MISTLRRIVTQCGQATITAREFDQLQTEWITRVGADDLLTAANERVRELEYECKVYYGIDREKGLVAQRLLKERLVSDKLEKALEAAEVFINQHSEPWYNSGQRLLADVRAALTAVAAVRKGEQK